MHDHEIRTVIGQFDHKNDKADAQPGTFSYMMDQSYRNTYYSGGNYEYVIHKMYTARWRFYRFQGVPQSTTRSHLTSYDWPGNYDGSKNTKGDGRVNWTGQPRCGPDYAGGAGISCRNNDNGIPSNSLRGGRGCHRNRGYDRWHGTLHVYMMETNHDSYLYVCNGPQHSSGNRFAHRTWMRTADTDLVA